MEMEAAFYSGRQLDAASVGSSGAVVSGLPSRVAEAVARCLITFVFATVGAILGAITGALIGLATESGLVRGAGIGSISGAVVAMEVVERSMDIWRSDESGIWSVVYVLDVIWSLLTGRLVRDKVDPAVQSAVDSQMNAAFLGDDDDDAAPMLSEIFGTSGAVSGMAARAIAALPSTTLTERTPVALDGGCSVCLQDLVAGETARLLPECGHAFHVACIDGWLCRHASCPLCRRAVQ